MAALVTATALDLLSSGGVCLFFKSKIAGLFGVEVFVVLGVE